jgi:TolB-like protein/Tfp pilus assembly protein PilF
MAVALLIFDNYYLDRRVVEPETAITETDQTPVPVEEEEATKTIAVLPFDDLSPDKDQEYFVDGLSEEIINYLVKIPDLKVIGRTSSFTFKGSNKKTPEIANELGVGHILEGSVRKAGNDLRITTQLLRGADGFHLWSKTYDRKLKDIFALQEDIATAVAKELKLTLGIGTSFTQVGGTNNVKAYELYMIAQGQYINAINTWSNALESIDAAIALDPEYALAWALKASIHNSNSMTVSMKSALAELNEGRIAAEKAIELEPNLAISYVSLGANNVIRGEFAEAGISYRKALELSTGPISVNNPEFYFYYLSLGYFEKAQELCELAQQNDPLNPVNRRMSIMNFGIIGDMRRAEEAYESTSSLPHDLSYDKVVISMVRLGGNNSLTMDDLPEIPGYKIWTISRKHLESPDDGLSELRKYYADSENLTAINLLNISIWAARFGDPELALDAMERVNRINSANISYVWLPVYQEVRQLHRFKEFVREFGLVDYWNEFGWPDICQPTDNGDFVCD